MSQFDTASGPDTSASEPSATITAAEQQAKAFIEGLRALVAANLPKLDLPHPLTTPAVRRHRNVPPSFAKAVATMVALNPDMQAVKQYDVEENKADQQQVDAYSTVEQELITLLKGVHFLVATKQAKTNLAAFQMQAFTEALTKDPAFAHLLPALDTIKQARRSNRSKAKPQPQSPTGTTPQNGGVIPPH